MKFIVNICLLLQLKIIKSFSIDEYLNDSYNYGKELCSYNGKPIYNKTTNEVTCECNIQYTDEPDKKAKIY